MEIEQKIRLVGPDAEAAAFHLQQELRTVEATDSETEVDTRKHGLDAVALVGLIFGGISTADVVWKWWSKYRSSGLRIVLEDDEGAEQELTSSSEAEFKRLLSPDGQPRSSDPAEPA